VTALQPPAVLHAGPRVKAHQRYGSHRAGSKGSPLSRRGAKKERERERERGRERERERRIAAYRPRREIAFASDVRLSGLVKAISARRIRFPAFHARSALSANPLTLGLAFSCQAIKGIHAYFAPRIPDRFAGSILSFCLLAPLPSPAPFPHTRDCRKSRRLCVSGYRGQLSLSSRRSRAENRAKLTRREITDKKRLFAQTSVHACTACVYAE